ncbi:hypothetical protein Tco_0553854 [Tanacetum coccineum]
MTAEQFLFNGVLAIISLLTQKHFFITTTDKHGVPPMKRLFKVAMLDPSPNLLVHGERLEIWDKLGWYVPSKVALDYDNSSLVPQLQNVSPSADTAAPSQQELDLLFGPLYDEFFTTGTSSVIKSSSPIDNSKQPDTPPTTNIQSSTLPTTSITNVNAEENNDNLAADTQF